MMKYAKIVIVVMSLAICTMGWAGDDTVSDDKPAGRGVGLVEDVSGVMNKATALLSGNLEMTMELNKNRLSKDDYTYNALGQRVPKKTATKTGGALHSE